MSHRTVRSTTVYKGRKITVRKDIVSVNGKEHPIDVVDHPGAAVILPILRSGQLVLEKHIRYPVDEEIIEAPAGTLDPGESLEECAKRELSEETGYEADELVSVGTVYVTPGYSNETQHFYLARVERSHDQKLAPDEELTLLKVNVDDALEMIRNGEIKDLKTIALILKARLLGRI